MEFNRPLKMFMTHMQCPLCDGEMLYKETNEILTAWPPQFLHRCSKCGHTEKYDNIYPYVNYSEENDEDNDLH